jgi:hypothetical protein
MFAMSPAATSCTFCAKGIAVLVNVLDRHRAEDRAQMALERLHGDVLDVLGALAEELLRRRRDRNVVAFHLDLRHAIDAHRHAFARINFGRLHVDGEQLEREQVRHLDDRQDERAAAFHDAEAARERLPFRVQEDMLAAGDDEHLIGADLRIASRPNHRERKMVTTTLMTATAIGPRSGRKAARMWFMGNGAWLKGGELVSVYP